MDVKISVIMPVYNGGTFLEESINSILAQTFTEFEFIVINDGSTDDTEKIVLGYNDERICYIKIPENKGIVFCLNHGLSLAKGVYIARMDADDIAEAARLSIQYEYLEKNKQVQIAGSYTRLFNKNGLNKIREYPVSPNAIKSRALKEVPFAHPAVMFRSALIKNGDYYYDPAFYPAEDYELWTRLILKYETANITVPLLRYRLHDKQ
ncbi:MAG TPA: glycosyltransferase, partial [Panacibacter sp.]|nr:glycosyltransferase [Panacibacter sp.]